MSWQPQIEINGKWHGNRYRFDSEKRALEYAETIAARRAFRGDRIGDVRAALTNDVINQEEEV
jgi:hypothetical protein